MLGTGPSALGEYPNDAVRYNAAERDGACNPLAGAIALADAVVVVSPNYRSEILEPEHACGLHDLLTARADTIYGIRNGVETDVWNPANDVHFENHFTADNLTPKFAVQHALRAELGLAQPEAKERRSLAVVVSRLAHQKGIDELLAILPMLHGIPSQLAILGSGDAWLAGELRNAASHDPSNVAFVEGFVDGLGHRMIAGGDFLMMPSRFEPCGLTQMQAMRYGTTPVVAGVGGLVDTVIDDDEHPKTGTGFVAANHQSLAMLDAWHRAQRAWRIPQRRRAIQRRGMQADWSWNQPASAHVSLYEHLVSTRSTYAQ